MVLRGRSSPSARIRRTLSGELVSVYGWAAVFLLAILAVLAGVVFVIDLVDKKK